MKIKAPDEFFETPEEDTTKPKPVDPQKDDEFVQEIKACLEMPAISSKFVVEGEDSGTPQFQLEVLKKFTQLCREEVFPRHEKASELIQYKLAEMHCAQLMALDDVAQLLATTKQFDETKKQLEVRKALVMAKHQELEERVKEVSKELKNHCRNKTVAEKKMCQELYNVEKKVKDLKVAMVETKSKFEYYKAQVNVQTEEVRRHTKPLYLDKNRAVFMRSNLNSMREHIEHLVGQVRSLSSLMSELNEPTDDEDSSKH